MLNDKNIVCFGIGKQFYSYLTRLDRICNIVAFSDNDCKKWSRQFDNKGRKCIQPLKIKDIENVAVIITLDNCEYIDQVKKQLDGYGVDYYNVLDVLNCIDYKIDKNNLYNLNIIKKFIDITLEEVTVCNFKCEYCFVWRKQKLKTNNIMSEHTVAEMISAFSKTKLGGVCFINICAKGETTLAPQLVEFIEGLLEQGHYVSIVTNGTVKKTINKILQLPDMYLKRFFFKISFHMLELKTTNLMNVFWENIQNIKKSCCSYTIEITPSDDIIQYVPEIKSMFMNKMDGAMPHITFTRDSKKGELDLLSNKSLDEYIKIWGEFNSELFELKTRLYGKKIKEICYTGSWCYIVNLYSGNIKACYGQEVIGNIYDRNMNEFPNVPTKCNCKMPYCFNGHSFVAWGGIPGINEKYYVDVRDRVDFQKQHWVKEPMYSFMKHKLYESNYDYINNKWSDYEKLMIKDRKPSIVIFNSADYENMGDIAISYSQRVFYQKYFPDYELIEISCEQYQIEKNQIFDMIIPDDVIVISGGGYLGSLWLSLEDATLSIISKLKNNKIVVMPQTIYFESNNVGKIEQKNFYDTLLKHKHIKICARDKYTYDEINKQMKNEDTYLIPDIAMFIQFNKKVKLNDTKILLCIRNDKESLLWNEEYIYKKITYKYTNYKIDRITKMPVVSTGLDERTQNIKNIYEYLSSYKIVITDRLHCMILCAVFGIPCVALDNVSYKISGSYEWLKDLKYIKCINQEEDVVNAVEQILGVEIDKKEFEIKIQQIYEKFAKSLRKDLGI